VLKLRRSIGRAIALVTALTILVAAPVIGSAPARPVAALASGRAAATLEGGADGPFAVGKIVMHFIDTRRHVHFRGRPREPRPVETVIWYPATTDLSGGEPLPAARPATASGPFPLVVFGHGYDSTPAVYTSLLRAWARAGYVVAAPIFPRTNAHAPGGPDEFDIVNQPADMSFVITRILAASAADDGLLAGLVDPHEVAVAGHSDGAATALATAYDSRYLDRRVDAAVILSGAEALRGHYFRGSGPPLLASEGTADRVNLPKYTYQYFRAAHAPKYLLRMIGAPHLRPYIKQPQLGVVERVTVAFLDLYLKGLPAAVSRLRTAGTDEPRLATLSADP